ncbi:hypothetical protein Cni_G02609 [Canna indica]|uniref:Uncharacterized protein n=1 Tax=Canna indica TaxID=4628 RepID=A0AAQ3Q0E8_9LILI|nr:hypothetical protein Cni_G02609 [Canna indica]
MTSKTRILHSYIFLPYKAISSPIKGYNLSALAISPKMSSDRVMGSCCFFFFLLFSSLLQLARGQAMAPSPMSSDGTAVDQGIAYVLMLAALLVTYLLH